MVRSLCYAFWREPRRRDPKAVTRQLLSFGMNWLMPCLPPTQPLSVAEALKRRPSSEWKLEAEEITQAPPRPRFEPGLPAEPAYAGLEAVTTAKRPKIVVPVSMITERGSVAPHLSAKDIVRAFPDQPRNGKAVLPRQPKPSSRSKRFLVALVLIVCFSGMLWATHRYVTSNWNPLLRIPLVRECVYCRPRRCYDYGCEFKR